MVTPEASGPGSQSWQGKPGTCTGNGQEEDFLVPGTRQAALNKGYSKVRGTRGTQVNLSVYIDFQIYSVSSHFVDLKTSKTDILAGEVIYIFHTDQSK